MSYTKNKFSLIATIAAILITGVGGYFLMKFKQGPYPASSFVSVQYRWGDGDTLRNSYNSITGDYQFLDSRDSLIKEKVRLNANNMLFLHSRAVEAGLWELPAVIGKVDTNSHSALRYELVFNYEQKTKKIVVYPAQVDSLALAKSASALRDAVMQTIKDAAARNPGN